MLSLIQPQKGISNKALVILSKHISLLFEMCQDELMQIVDNMKEEQRHFDVKMTPIKIANDDSVEDPETKESEKVLLSHQVFRHKVEMSDRLFDLCRFSIANREIFNKIMSAVEASKEQSTFKKMINYMPNVLNFKRK